MKPLHKTHHREWQKNLEENVAPFLFAKVSYIIFGIAQMSGGGRRIPMFFDIALLFLGDIYY